MKLRYVLELQEHLKPWRGLIVNALHFFKKELKKQQDFQAQTETLELQNRLRGKKIKRTCKFRLTTTKIFIAKPRYIERISGSPRETLWGTAREASGLVRGGNGGEAVMSSERERNGEAEQVRDNGD